NNGALRFNLIQIGMNPGKYKIAAIVLLWPIFVNVMAPQASGPSDAAALEQQGKFFEAAEIWRAVTEHNPHDAAAFASLGIDLARQQKYAEAVPAYQKALALNPRLPGIQLNLGLAEFKQGHFEAAIAPFSK